MFDHQVLHLIVIARIDEVVDDEGCLFLDLGGDIFDHNELQYLFFSYLVVGVGHQVEV